MKVTPGSILPGYPFLQQKMSETALINSCTIDQVSRHAFKEVSTRYLEDEVSTRYLELSTRYLKMSTRYLEVHESNFLSHDP